jgi:hypothetical protein
MIKLLDFLLIVYFLFFIKYKQRGLEGSILILTAPLTLFIIAVSIYLIHFIIKNSDVINPISIGVLFLIFSISINILLKKKYLLKYEYILKQSERFNNIIIKILAMIFAILFYVFSVLIFFFSFRFLQL